MATILIFDSGVGGLSIAASVVDRLPDHELIFASDNASYPYGTKSEEELIPRVLNVTERLIQETQADILVVACNTASTVVLPALRERLSIDVVGVVPAIKPAAKLSVNKHIGVLATPATIGRQYTQELINIFAQGCEVDLLGSSELVDLAEQKIHQGCVSLSAIKQAINPWLAPDNSMDTVVLACTHFPLLKAELDQLFTEHHKNIYWVDSANGIAKRVEYLLVERESLQSPHRQRNSNSDKDKDSQNNNLAIFTAKFEVNNIFAASLKKLGIDTVRCIDM